MTDLLSFFEGAPFSEAVYEWQRLYMTLRYRSDHTPRLAVWSFQGEQPVAGGLAALFSAFFRWRGSDFRLFVTDYGENDDGEPTWDPINLEIAPDTMMPIYAQGAAHIWGKLDGDSFSIDYQFGDEAQHWELQGDVLTITRGLIALVPQILARMGIRTTEWTPEEELDITDPAVMENLLRAWGEVNVRAHITSEGFEEYSDALAGAIRRILNAATIGSRFACWAATHALLSVAADGFSPHAETAKDALVGLASVNPRSAWPSIALALLDWEHEDLESAGELLETAVEADPRVIPAWALLSLLYADNGDVAHAEGVCREAIAGNVADPSVRYALAVLLLDHGGETEADDEKRVQEALTLLEQAEVDGLADPMVALRAMDAAEALDNEEALWTAFERILDYDSEGSTIFEVVEYAESYTDFSQGLALLQKAAEARASYMLYAALARALLRCERNAEAKAIIETLRGLAEDDYAKAETAQLALEARDPAFEDRFRELMNDLDDGIIPDSAMINFLMAAIDAEPEFADGAVALAESYEARDEIEAATAVLAKARGILPAHLELVLATTDLLWIQDEDEAALALLLQAHTDNPDDVSIIARLAEYYFEIGDDEQSRMYLERAEALDPSHPEFLRVEEQIADTLVDEDEFSDQDNIVDE